MDPRYHYHQHHQRYAPFSPPMRQPPDHYGSRHHAAPPPPPQQLPPSQHQSYHTVHAPPQPRPPPPPPQHHPYHHQHAQFIHPSDFNSTPNPNPNSTHQFHDLPNRPRFETERSHRVADVDSRGQYWPDNRVPRQPPASRESHYVERRPVSPIERVRHDLEGSSRFRNEYDGVGFEQNRREEFVRVHSDLQVPDRSSRDYEIESKGFELKSRSSDNRYDSPSDRELISKMISRPMPEGMTRNGRRSHDSKSVRKPEYVVVGNNDFGSRDRDRDREDPRFVSRKRDYHDAELERYNDRGSREGSLEFNRTPKKQVQKKSAFLRIQLAKPNHQDREDERSHHLGTSSEVKSGSFNGKDQPVNSDDVMEEERREHREESMVDLDVSFKSNSLVAKATVAPSSSAAAVSETSLTPRASKIRKVAASSKDCSSSPQPTKVKASEIRKVAASSKDCSSSPQPTKVKAGEIRKVAASDKVSSSPQPTKVKASEIRNVATSNKDSSSSELAKVKASKIRKVEASIKDSSRPQPTKGKASEIRKVAAINKDSSSLQSTKGKASEIRKVAASSRDSSSPQPAKVKASEIRKVAASSKDSSSPQPTKVNEGSLEVHDSTCDGNNRVDVADLSNLMPTGGSAPFERPRTPPLPSLTKVLNHSAESLRDDTSSSLVEPPPVNYCEPRDLTCPMETDDVVNLSEDGVKKSETLNENSSAKNLDSQTEQNEANFISSSSESKVPLPSLSEVLNHSAEPLRDNTSSPLMEPPSVDYCEPRDLTRPMETDDVLNISEDGLKKPESLNENSLVENLDGQTEQNEVNLVSSSLKKVTHVMPESEVPLPSLTNAPNHSAESLRDDTSSALMEPSSIDYCESRDLASPMETDDMLNLSVNGLKDSGTLNENNSVENLGSQTEQNEANLVSSSLKRVTYVKPKSNQLVATSNQCKSSIYNAGKNQTVASLYDGYYKRSKNQLIRTASESQSNQSVIIPRDKSNSAKKEASGGRTFSKRHNRKVTAKNYKPSKFSLVWTLSNNSGDSLRRPKILPQLFPWKRVTYWRNFMLNSASSRASFLTPISRKLLLSRKRNTVYTRSSNGYSLRKSKVLSVGCSSLKWSKTIESQSKKANEEATLAVAAAERKKREQTGIARTFSRTENKINMPHKIIRGERIYRVGSVRYKMDPSRRTLQRISEEESSCSASYPPENNVKKPLVPKRLIIDNEEYVRIGNGNQLVRNPKKRTRILASEKVRWSLHTARMKLSKKRKYCQFFTRFGKCNKDDGKCPYIHDSSKIAVCTKFIKGQCSNRDCNLTHKVIPERMPDCSYYLQGLCTNDNCPYRHVHVNPKASTCEGFLKGYCADGDECRKKHSYICPIFEATGSCPQGSKCKLHHPKKRSKSKKNRQSREQKNLQGRYFGSTQMDISEPGRAAASERQARVPNLSEDQFSDFISLGVSDGEAGESLDATSEQTTSREEDFWDSVVDDLDALIKPVAIMNKSSITLSSPVGV